MMIRRFPGIFLFLLVFRLSVAAQQGEKGAEPGLDTTVAVPESGGVVAPPEESPTVRHLPDTTVYRLQRDRRFAYANDPEYWKIRRQQQSDPGRWLARILRSTGFKYTVLTLLAGLLLFAIVRIVMENNLGLFYWRAKGNTAAGEQTDGLPPQEDIDQQLQHFLQAGDKRQATRYLYLKTLHLLSDRDLIQWHAEATNQEYLRQLKGSPSETAFHFLTGAYEQVWYGHLVPGEASFRRLYEHFTNFYKSLEA